RTGNPFVCLEDISQTRLPYYIHALLPAHFAISFTFSLITLLAVYAYTRREYGALAATVFAALYATSPQLLAGGRMVITHSGIIVTCFTTLSLLALLLSGRREQGAGGRSDFEAASPTLLRPAPSALRPHFIASAVFTGLAAASSVLAAFNVLFLGAIYVTRCKKSWRDLWFIPIAAVTFFATTIIYLSPALLRALIEACFHGGEYPFWNYLGLGTNKAQWFFPFLLLLIKVGPWVVFAFHRQARWFLVAFGVQLLLKGTVFGYETPHHQMQFYPLLYMFIAVGIVRWRRPWVIAIVVALFLVQVRDVVRFFPHYLFYGAQYGQRFIGEFYGPAVIHAQGRERVNEVIDAILIRKPEAKILVADHNAFDRIGPNFVPFTKRDPNVRYEFALVDRLYATHFSFPEREAYNAFLAAHYDVAYETKFPPGVWVYRVMELE
ncbi:MAG TPA: hypothetical protein VF883_17980, partial [Thermoanaerobaculia bacterium]